MKHAIKFLEDKIEMYSNILSREGWGLAKSLTENTFRFDMEQELEELKQELKIIKQWESKQ